MEIRGKPLEETTLGRHDVSVSVSPVPDDLRQFLAQHVQSVAQLEILLLLTSTPERWWRPSEVYKIVLSNEKLVGKTLETFTKNGLMRKSAEVAYQFSPASDQINALANNLAVLYRERPGRIIQAIYEAPVSEIEEFAKAFKIRKKP